MIDAWKQKTKNFGEYKIIYLTKNTFNFFWGYGWDSQAKFKRDGKTFSLLQRPTRSLPRDINVILSKMIGV